MVEHGTENAGVDSSSLSLGTTTAFHPHFVADAPLLIFLPILPPVVSTTIFPSFRKGIRGFLLPAREEVTLDVPDGGDTGMTQPPAGGQEALAFWKRSGTPLEAGHGMHLQRPAAGFGGVAVA